MFASIMASGVSLDRKRKFDQVHSAPKDFVQRVKTRRLAATPSFHGDEKAVRLFNEAFQTLEAVTQCPILLGNIQMMVDSGLGFADMMAEIGALHYLLTCTEVDPKTCESYFERLLSDAEKAIKELYREHINCVGANAERVACGRYSLIRLLFVDLMLPPSVVGIFHAGLATVRKLLGPNIFTGILNVELTHSILHTLDLFEEDASFFGRPIILHPSLYSFCALDQKKSEITNHDMMQWILQMLFCDILQQDYELNCYAIVALKFAIAHDLKKFLGIVRDFLEKGYYKIGDIEIEIFQLMREKLVRKSRLEVTIQGPMAEHSVFARCFSLANAPFPIILEGSSLSTLFNNTPVAAHYYCSYFENLLQRMVLEYFHLVGVNGISHHPADYGFEKKTLLHNLASHLSPSFDQTPLIFRILGKIIWLWDCGIEREQEEFMLEGITFSTSGVESLIKRGRSILILYRGKTIRVATLTQFVKLLGDCLTDAAIDEPSFLPETLEYVKKRLEYEKIKEMLASIIAQIIKRKMPQFHAGLLQEKDLCLLCQSGGRVSSIFRACDIAYREKIVEAENPDEIVKNVRPYVQGDRGTCVIFSNMSHVMTIPGGLSLNQEVPHIEATTLFLAAEVPENISKNVIRSHYSEQISRSKLKSVKRWTVRDFFYKSQEVFQQNKKVKIVEKIVTSMQTMPLENLKLLEICALLGVNPSVVQRQEVLEILRENVLSYRPNVWAYALSSAFAHAKIGVFHPHDVEVALRKAHTLPAIHFLANANWTDGRNHTHWRLEGADGFAVPQIWQTELLGREPVASSFEYCSLLLPPSSKMDVSH
ncbi:MAG: hypothetical protein H7A36_05325 [Chlamydiales bacterium]|nr:hypothetical protein [Chlamydiales bacterium]